MSQRMPRLCFNFSTQEFLQIKFKDKIKPINKTFTSILHIWKMDFLLLGSITRNAASTFAIFAKFCYSNIYKIVNVKIINYRSKA